MFLIEDFIIARWPKWHTGDKSMTPLRVNASIKAKLNGAHIASKKNQKKVAAAIGDIIGENSEDIDVILMTDENPQSADDDNLSEDDLI